MRTFIAFGFVLWCAGTACNRQTPSNGALNPDAKHLTVFAAASTIDVMQEAGRRFEASTGTKVAFSFDSSSNLARQIKAGAPVDVFISADEKWMDDVASAGELQTSTRQDLLGNQLVLIAPAGKGFEMRMTKDFAFATSLPQIRRIAVGDPSHVPAGRYARQALESLGWWNSLQESLVPTQDVRAALKLVEIGEADAGIVYTTDSKQSDKVRVVATFPSETHDPIRYPVAVCKDGSPVAIEYLRFLRTIEMKQVFEQAGFVVLPPSGDRGKSGP